MRPSSRIVPALALGGLLLVPGSPCLAGPPPQEPRTKAEAPASGNYKSLDELNAAYDRQFADLDRRRMADLTALAAKLPPEQAEAAYRDIFTLAVTRDTYDPAAKAADAYLASGKTTPQNAALAHFVQIIAEANRGDYDKAIGRLDAFLRSQRNAGADPNAKPDPGLVFAVGEAFVQRLIAAGKYETARKVAGLFESYPESSVKEHFTARASRLDRLGKDAPAFSATDVDGKTVSLADYKGKVVLIDFWATWAPPSVAEVPHLSYLASQYGDKGFAVLGVNVDAARNQGGGASRDGTGGRNHNPLPDVRRFLMSYKVPYTNVMNGTGQADIARLYGVTDIPANFLIGKDGKILRVETFGTDLDQAVAEALGEKKVETGDTPKAKR